MPVPPITTLALLPSGRRIETFGAVTRARSKIRIHSKSMNLLWLRFALSHDPDIVGKNIAKVRVPGSKIFRDDIGARARWILVQPSCFGLVYPMRGNYHVTGLKSGIETPGNPAEQDRVWMKMINRQLGRHGGVDHTDTAHPDDQTPAAFLHLRKDRTVDFGVPNFSIGSQYRLLQCVHFWIPSRNQTDRLER